MYNRYFIVILAVFCATVMAGCTWPGTAAQESIAPSSEAEPPAPVVVPVEAVPAERGEIAEYRKTVSKIEAEHRVEVHARGSGQVLSVHAEEGDLVRAGQVLAELDKAEAQAQFRQTEVQYRQHQTDYERARRSFDAGLSSQMELDNARFAYESSRASLEAQRIQLANLTVRAPIDGLVISRLVRVGELVSAGAPVFVIVDPATFFVAVDLDERQVPNLRIGQEARVSVRSLPGELFTASIRRINPSVDPNSGTVRVLLDFERSARTRLREAAHAEVELLMDKREDAVLAPKVAVLERNARRFVYVVEAPETGMDDSAAHDLPGGTMDPVYVARRIEVATGLEDSEHYEIREGLQGGELVVTLGQHTLEPGTRVRVVTASEQLEAAAELSTEESLAQAQEERERAQQAASGAQ